MVNKVQLFIMHFIYMYNLYHYMYLSELCQPSAIEKHTYILSMRHLYFSFSWGISIVDLINSENSQFFFQMYGWHYAFWFIRLLLVILQKSRWPYGQLDKCHWEEVFNMKFSFWKGVFVTLTHLKCLFLLTAYIVYDKRITTESLVITCLLRTLSTLPFFRGNRTNNPWFH